MNSMGPKCGICDKAVDMGDCVELIVIAHRAKDEVPLGSMFYHMDCYLDENANGEPTKQQQETRKARGPLTGGR